MEFIKEDLVKSPLNYTGGKFKLLPQILPLFPDNIHTFVDLFAGGCNVGVNVKANNIICNDIESVVIDFMKSVKNTPTYICLNQLDNAINKYGLSKTNEEGFKNIRNDYNAGERDWYMFYAMLTHSFNYQIRFNKNNEYNMPFGRDRSSFNPNLRKNFINFIDKIHSLDIRFISKDFSTIKPEKLSSNDLVYCDPPYLITCASYNEQDGWNETREKQLLTLLDALDKDDIKFALSNVLESKGKSNDILKEWSKKYNVHYLNNTYGNCNYQTKDKSKTGTIEVLITNY